MAARPYSGGRVHVCEEMCSTCVFRPGNLMMLEPGRLAGMVRDSVAADSAIICHSTLYGQTEQEAVCRGFFDRHKTTPLQMAERLGMIAWSPVTVTPIR